ncbi:MAG: hypothetical protein RQ862_07000 [Candidatus Caldarchaeales archaeon]|jgi:hypothetical protein|nr:hypothetical protein [Candidatus Caldarchaeales archaeon]
MMERAEGENRKIRVKILYNRYYWAIQYKKKNLQMDGAKWRHLATLTVY